MTVDNNLPCWEIMRCEDTENCPARQNPETPCWEIAYDVGDHLKASNICNDCIVYLLKSGNSTLSEQEITAIMQSKANCVLA